MTIAAVLTIFVTLSLVGVAMLVYFWNAQGTNTVEKAVRFEVFMIPNANQDQIDSVRTALEKDKKDHKVTKITFYSKEQAYEFFKEYFKEDKELVNSITKDALPVSFLVAPSQSSKSYMQNLTDKYSAIPGVEKIQTTNFEDEIQRAKTINQTLGIFAFVLLIASCVLVFNTVRLAVYARRREIEIMKLVGASNWFVQVPFMAEGAVQGLVGGIAASFSVYVFENTVIEKQFSSVFKGFFVSTGQVWLTLFIIVALGITIGFVSSYVGLKRYLDV